MGIPGKHFSKHLVSRAAAFDERVGRENLPPFPGESGAGEDVGSWSAHPEPRPRRGDSQIPRLDTFPKDLDLKVRKICCPNMPVPPNEGVTCPVIATPNSAGKDFWPHPHAGGSAAPAGSGLRGVRWLILGL